MARYTKEQIDSVAQTDMVDFLASEYGWTIVKVGNCYSTKEHDSIRIRPDRKFWYWNSQKIGGKGLIEWLRKIENMDFKEIMSKMVGTIYPSAEIAEYSTENSINHGNTSYFDEKNIPQKTNGKYSNAFVYLTKTRCISAGVVSELMKSHRIYQDIKNNVVFVNPNEKGEVGFWCLRGTNTEKKFTRNMSGSNNPYYGFALDAQCECDTLYVFEAPIDLLSHCTIADIKYGTGSWHNQHRIALCGVNDTAMRYYLSSHKNINTIKFCLDNDEAGRTATQKLMAKYYELGYRTQSISYKCPGKDINEMLCNYVNKTKQKSDIQTEPTEKQPAKTIQPEEKRAEEKSPLPASLHNSANYARDYMGLY